MEREKSCGGIIFRIHQWVFEFLLVQQRHGGHWFFPKGHVEKGETEEETALREIYEEVWLSVKILPEFRYSFSYYLDAAKTIEKTVVFFVCALVSWSLIISDELQDYIWLPYEKALQRLTYDDAKSALTKAYIFLAT